MKPAQVARISSNGMALGERRIPSVDGETIEGHSRDVGWLLAEIEELQVPDTAVVFIRAIHGNADDADFREHQATFNAGKLVVWLREQPSGIKVSFMVNDTESAIGDIEVADDPKRGHLSLYFYDPCACEDDDHLHGHEPCCPLSRHYEPPL